MNLTVIRQCTRRNVLIARDSIIHHLHRCLLTLVLPLIALSLGTTAASHAVAQEGLLHPYLTSGMIATQQRLQAPCDQSLRGPLELVVNSLSQSYELPIWIDRKIPRDKVIDATVSKGNLESVLVSIAQQAIGEIVLVDGVVLIVPIDLAEPLNVAYWNWKTSKVPSNWTRLETSSFEWKTGAEMIDVARQLCQRYKLEDAWVEELEHDVWPASSFQKVPAGSIATCILASMRKQLEWDGKSATIVPIPNKVPSGLVEWSYPASQIEKLGNEHCKQWKSKNPEVKIEKKSGQWIIQANVTSHQKLIQPLLPAKKWVPPSKDNAVYSGVLQGSLGYAVDALSKAMAVEFSPLPLPDKVAQREVRVEYKNASLEKILQDLGVAGRVEFRKQANRYEIIILD